MILEHSHADQRRQLLQQYTSETRPPTAPFARRPVVVLIGSEATNARAGSIERESSLQQLAIRPIPYHDVICCNTGLLQPGRQLQHELGVRRQTTSPSVPTLMPTTSAGANRRRSASTAVRSPVARTIAAASMASSLALSTALLAASSTPGRRERATTGREGVPSAASGGAPAAVRPTPCATPRPTSPASPWRMRRRLRLTVMDPILGQNSPATSADRFARLPLGSPAFLDGRSIGPKAATGSWWTRDPVSRRDRRAASGGA